MLTVVNTEILLHTSQILNSVDNIWRMASLQSRSNVLCKVMNVQDSQAIPSSGIPASRISSEVPASTPSSPSPPIFIPSPALISSDLSMDQMRETDAV
ncbi:hypothetical protein NPIL_59811 [Nephila pilipes]|uniref:Uncharacterized protein n=1 Tax=Nephila pilipes TaxID=299642 RepID=A0A8X6P6H3_NEPPI|nr:hypothetical protein NPIL_59811 [Nephila pilipes]